VESNLVCNHTSYNRTTAHREFDLFITSMITDRIIIKGLLEATTILHDEVNASV